MPTIVTRIQRLLKKTERMKTQAVKSLLQTLKHIEKERKARTADLEEAAKVVLKQLEDLGHSGLNSKAAATRTKRMDTIGKKRRIRRSSEQLKAEATKILAMIRKAGKDGIGGAEIRKSFPGVGQSITAFVQKNAGVKLKTTGEKSTMRYQVG